MCESSGSRIPFASGGQDIGQVITNDREREIIRPLGRSDGGRWIIVMNCDVGFDRLSACLLALLACFFGCFPVFEGGELIEDGDWEWE